MRRDHTFPLRLGDEERDDLERRAAEEGIAKADVIRAAMGWDPVGLIGPDPAPLAAGVPDLPAPEPTGSPADDDGPGARGISELARRIAERGR